MDNKLKYTVEIYKKDRRKKEGERQVEKVDVVGIDLDFLTAIMEESYTNKKGYRLEFHETYVEKFNAVGGNKFIERYDTPYYCSPSSETYWCM